MGNARAAACPTCKGPVPRDSKARPFCSERCRLADLGKWFKEDYVFHRPLRPGETPPGDAGESAEE